MSAAQGLVSISVGELNRNTSVHIWNDRTGSDFHQTRNSFVSGFISTTKGASHYYLTSVETNSGQCPLVPGPLVLDCTCVPQAVAGTKDSTPLEQKWGAPRSSGTGYSPPLLVQLSYITSYIAVAASQLIPEVLMGVRELWKKPVMSIERVEVG
ncbi:hypothetical protein P691DRAFT_781097 [Macrolepiota fuliginosa MF-IS2]|uniref:Uncharacterized protein n=1 Tax=Macrolepiota fuliginosa MF-IS2 TaxID=1400762 RepID=A0A9P5XDN6_9AGAR|nr:hypothetical protein P691DRAFT_781097 [Macrolepiota fuliginosa MF-IS2]